MQFQLAVKDPHSQQFPAGLFELAKAFLNDNLGTEYYGPALFHLVLAFRKNFPPPKRKPKTARIYKGSFAEHILAEVEGSDVKNSELSAARFRELLELVRQRTLSTRDLWDGAFRSADFDRDFNKLLLQAPATDAELRNYAQHIAEVQDRGRLRVQLGEEKRRIQLHRPCDVRFVGIRCYEHGRLDGRLQPHLANYSLLLEGLLRNLELKCPVYREIYINLAESIEDARRQRVAIEDWHENAYATIRLAEYEAANDDQRGQMVLAALVDSLRELAKIDHLDLEAIERAAAQIEETGLDTDMIYLKSENKRFNARVLYRATQVGGDPVFRLEVQDKSSGQTGTIDLGRYEMWWLPYRFGRLIVTSKEVRIEPRAGLRAKVALKSEKAKPVPLRFTYGQIFR